MQLYRVFMKYKYNSCVLRPQISIANFYNNPKTKILDLSPQTRKMNKCGYKIGLNAMLVLSKSIEIIGFIKCWTPFQCMCTLNRIKQSNIHTNNNIKIRCLTMAFFSSPTPCYYPTTTTNINSHTTLHR